jgi:hypothetical protein
MEIKDTAPKTLDEIDLGSLVQSVWRTFLKEIKPLG